MISLKTKKNKELLNGVNDLLLSNSKIKDDNMVDLLPFDNKNVKSFSNIQSFDICRGQQYAINHATNPNKNEYKYFPTGDCANFASQILEKSGVKQVTSNSVLSGWWHKKVNKKHKQSNSWSLADVFARYMGIGYKTSNHEEFSKHLKSGDFIAVDFDSDGDWDHIGFLVNYNPNGACYGPNNCYNDYRVAQHTKNYNEWVTSSKNNWETLGNDGGTYARVRR